MQELPFLRLACHRADLAAAEDWIDEALADEAELGSYYGFRIETGEEPTAHLVLSFGDEAARDRAAVRVETRALGPEGPTPSLRVVERGVEPEGEWRWGRVRGESAVPLGRLYQSLPAGAHPVAGRRSIRVPRSHAFGTGEHASTRLAASWVEEVARQDEPMLDLGCGTALLAAVGHGQGARPVVALDHDLGAVQVAKRTARDNDLRDLLVVCGTVAALDPGCRFGTVTANLERDLILTLLPDLARMTSPGGQLILSGLLVDQAEAVLEAARAAGLGEVGRRADGEWVALALAAHPALRPRALVTPGSVHEGRVELDAEEAHHLRRVRRVRDREPVQVLDGVGGVWGGRLHVDPGGRVAVVDLTPEQPGTEPALQVTLLQAVPEQAGQMDDIIRSATEIGAAIIQPVVTARCQAPSVLLRGTRVERWQRIAAEAVKQCGRVRVPELEAPRSVADIIAAPFDGLSLLLDPHGPRLSRLLTGPPPCRIRVLVGPEGGFTPEERAAAVRSGFVPCGLGPRILRTGTAAASVLALLLAAWGDPGAKRRGFLDSPGGRT